MNRIDALIKDPNIYYDDKKVEGYIAFCERELTLTDGSDLNLLDSFKLWAEQVYGWYYYQTVDVYVHKARGRRGGRFQKKRVLRRLVKKQFIIVARGAAKTMYGSTIQAFYMCVDPSTTHQVTCAPTMRQAEEILTPFRTAITRARGPLLKMLTMGSVNNTTGNRKDRVKLASTKKGVQNFMTGSLLEVIPMTVDKAQGLQNKVSTVDEWLSGDTKEDVIGALEQGATKLPDYLIVAMSSEGTVRNGVGDEIKMELMDILKGVYVAPHVSIWYYRLDDVREVNNPKNWIKANPNIGKTVSWEAYALDKERAEKAPATRNDILAKRFGIPMEGYTYYFSYKETIPHKYRNFDSMRCSLGMDASQGDDFCAFTFIFPLPDGRFGIKARSYVSELSYSRLPRSLRRKYDEFIDEESLAIMDGTVLDMQRVFEDLENFYLKHEYDILTFGYDPYNAEEFIKRWITENGEWGVAKVQQGVRTESVPLGELKKLSEERMLLFDEEIMKFTMGNCIALEDTNGNRKLYKKRREEKIDNVAAMLDAFVVYKNFRDAFE